MKTLLVGLFMSEEEDGEKKINILVDQPAVQHAEGTLSANLIRKADEVCW